MHALRALLAEASVPEEARGLLALGLGHLGWNGPPMLASVRAFVQGAQASASRLQATKALALLRDADVVPSLIKRLASPGAAESERRADLVALARAGDERAIPPLLTLLEDAATSHDLRALACECLGVVCDLEWVPSLALLTGDLNYRAQTPLVRELLEML